MVSIQQLGVLLIVTGMLAACGGGGGSSGSDDNNQDGADLSVVARTSPIPVGDPDCPSGGILVESGIDENGNGLLDNNEVDSAEKVCNGNNGLNALVLTTPEPESANCARGGWRIDSGIDTDNDNILDPGEITSTAYICNADDGQANWRGMETISDNNSEDSDNPQVALNENGDGVAVWNQAPMIAGLQDIRAARYDRTLGWTVPVTIDSSNLGDAFSPKTVIDRFGNITVVWTQDNGAGRFDIWANRYDAVNLAWGTAALIETDDAGDAFSIQVAVDDNGNVYAGWRQSNGTFFQIRGNYFDLALNSWSGAFDVSIDNLGDAEIGNIAFDNAGNAMFTWHEEDGVRNNGWGFYTLAGTNSGDAEELETYSGGDVLVPRVVFDSQGEAIAAWSQQDGGRFDIVSSRFQPGVGWGPSEPLENDTINTAFHRDIAADASGRLIALWVKDNAGISSVYAAEYDPVGGWATPELIEGSDSGAADFASLAMSPSGEAIAIWQQSDPGNANEILANRYDPFDGWETEQFLAAPELVDSLEPQIAINASGEALAVWKQQRNSVTFPVSIRSNRIVP